MTVQYHFRRGRSTQAPSATRLLPLLAIAMAACFPARAGASDPSPAPTSSGDYPMWGGRPDRNMVSDQHGLPTEWNLKEKRNLKWSVTLGSQTYGNPVISGGKVFVGTNNANPRNPDIKGDKGVLLCFAESDGQFLWQAVHDKLEPTDEHDWPDIGICSTPCVVGNRVYYVSNRGELVCADTEGFRDGKNDGPIQDEKAHGPADADLIWTLDIVKELGVSPYQASASSPLVLGDLVFVVTGNGFDNTKDKMAAPKAPSFIAVNRTTGKLVWSDSSPGDRILAGQWSAPAAGVVNGQPQVVFPGGDGWLYAFEPQTGKLLWKFDCNSYPTGSDAADPKARNHPVATPVFHDNKVFIAVGQAPESGSDGPGCLWAIDATKAGDVTKSPVWRYNADEFSHSISTVAIHDGLLYVLEMRGFLHCLEATTGNHLWKYDLSAAAWASPMVADGKVYIGTEDGDVHVLAHGREAKPLAKNRMKEQVYATVTPANGTLYIVDRTHLYAIAQGATPPATQPAAPSATTKPTASAPAATASAPAFPPSSKVKEGEWPMFRGNPQLTGVATAEPPATPKLHWKFRAGDTIESSAAIANGNAYVGCNDSFLYCVTLSTGGLKWKYQAAGPIKSSPLVHNGLVLFGDSDGTFHALDANAGTKTWSYKTDGEIISSANCAPGRILFGSYDGNLYCLNEADGKLLWKFETEGRVHGTPGVTGDKVLVAGCDEHLRVVKLEDGSAVGSVSMGSFSGASAAISGSRVFVGTFGNQVLGIDWAAQRIVWTYENPEDKSPFYGSAAVTPDLVVIGGRDKLVHALEAATGKKRWTFATKERIDSSPVVAGSRVFVGSTDGVLYALNLADGKSTWQFDAGAAITASPAVGDTIVFGTEDGTLYCLGS